MDKLAFENTAPDELKELGYTPPIIKSYDKNGINVCLTEAYGNWNHKLNEFWKLTVDGVQYMTLDKGHEQVFEFYSHYKLAKGHVICTGLGFGIREQWIATKPEVTKVTVLEKFEGVIDYHKDIGTKWSDKIEIIHCDANDYKGSCDFLSIDHIEFDDASTFIRGIKKICNNITHECAWFWLLETWIQAGNIYGNTKVLTEIGYEGKLFDLEPNYSKIKTYFEYVNLPNLNKEQLFKIINMYHRNFAQEDEN